MTTDILQPSKLEIGRVISQTFGVIGRNFVVFFVLSLVLSGIPTAIIGYVQAGMMGDAATTGTLSPGLIYSSIVGGLAAIITASILQGALVYGTVQDLNGARPNVGECLTTGLRAFLPLFVVSLLFGLAIGFGMILLIVPGIMIACAWCVAVPALVADRTTIGGAFRRAAELTRGNRWRIFGLFLAILGILLVLGLVVGLVSAAVIVPFVLAGAAPETLAAHPAMILVNAVSTALSSLLGSAGIAVLYVELRKAREGVGPEWLSRIFE
jgi:hypothetical protein